MPRRRARRNSAGGNLPIIATRRRRARANVPQRANVAAPEPKPIRGVKLKSVSLWTMLFALLCLGAFIAGRPPASAARLSATSASESHCGNEVRQCSAIATQARAHHRAAIGARTIKER